MSDSSYCEYREENEAISGLLGSKLSQDKKEKIISEILHNVRHDKHHSAKRTVIRHIVKEYDNKVSVEIDGMQSYVNYNCAMALATLFIIFTRIRESLYGAKTYRKKRGDDVVRNFILDVKTCEKDESVISVTNFRTGSSMKITINRKHFVEHETDEIVEKVCGVEKKRVEELSRVKSVYSDDSSDDDSSHRHHKFHGDHDRRHSSDSDHHRDNSDHCEHACHDDHHDNFDHHEHLWRDDHHDHEHSEENKRYRDHVVKFRGVQLPHSVVEPFIEEYGYLPQSELKKLIDHYEHKFYSEKQEKSPHFHTSVTEERSTVVDSLANLFIKLHDSDGSYVSLSRNDDVWSVDDRECGTTTGVLEDVVTQYLKYLIVFDLDQPDIFLHLNGRSTKISFQTCGSEQAITVRRAVPDHVENHSNHGRLCRREKETTSLRKIKQFGGKNRECLLTLLLRGHQYPESLFLSIEKKVKGQYLGCHVHSHHHEEEEEVVMKVDEYCVDKDKLLPILVGISTEEDINVSLFSKVPDVPPITTQVQNVV